MADRRPSTSSQPCPIGGGGGSRRDAAQDMPIRLQEGSVGIGYLQLEGDVKITCSSCSSTFWRGPQPWSYSCCRRR